MTMTNPYHQIAHQILSKNKNKHYKHFLQDTEVEEKKYLSKEFINAFQILKDAFPATYKLFGSENFKKLAYFYSQYFQVDSNNTKKYGKKFPEFIQSIPSLVDLKYIKWIAKLDWFWTRQEEQYILLPQGTLNSWGSVYKDSEQIEILIDEGHMEKLMIKKSGKEFSIIPV